MHQKQKHTRSGSVSSSLGAEAQREACGEEKCAEGRHDFAGLLRFGRWACGSDRLAQLMLLPWAVG
jgi:hypothetical protein